MVNKFSDDEIMLEVKDVMKYLGIGKHKAYDLFNSKKFPSLMFKGRHYIMKKDFMKYINSLKSA